MVSSEGRCAKEIRQDRLRGTLHADDGAAIRWPLRRGLRARQRFGASTKPRLPGHQAHRRGITIAEA